MLFGPLAFRCSFLLQKMSVVAPSGSIQYADLNIRHTGDPQKTLALVKRAIRMGYDVLAINIDVGDIATGEDPVDDFYNLYRYFF